MTKHLSLADVCGESLGYQSPSPLLPCDEHCYVAASHHSPANTQVERVWLCGNPLHCKEAGVWRQRCVYNHSTQKKKKDMRGDNHPSHFLISLILTRVTDVLEPAVLYLFYDFICHLLGDDMSKKNIDEAFTSS